MERLAELNLRVVHVPGKKNIPADVLSRYAQHVEGEVAKGGALHDITNADVEFAVRAWLSAVAPQLLFDKCVAAVADGLARGFPVASGPCKKCGATHADLD